MICRLCKINPADKTGSHIVPHFLLKRIDNIDGKIGRDYELGFVVKAFDTTSYFGRSVQTENLNEVFGELTDEEILQNKHPLIVDYFFCQKCEKRFANIETLYAKTLNKTDNQIYNSGISSDQGLLFWMSIIWRVSINKKNGVELSLNQNERLRRILNLGLKEDYTICNNFHISSLNDAKRISYRLLRSPDFSLENDTHFIWHPMFKHPYCLIIDEFILLFAFKDNYNDFSRLDLFGYKDISDAPKNILNGEEKIKPINPDALLEINKQLIYTFPHVLLEKINQFLNEVHWGLGGFGETMPLKLKKEIIEELNASDKKMGRKHNLTDLKNSTFKVLQKYGTIE